MAPSIDTENNSSRESGENDSPLGKRKNGLISPSCKSSDVPLATNNAASSYPSSSTSKSRFSKNRQLTASKVQATNDKRATVDQLLSRFSAPSNKKTQRRTTLQFTTPVKFSNKPRIKKEDVQATPNQRASVKTISSWLGDDPFEQKKKRVVRTGANVIAKSRRFEKQDKVLEELVNRVGSVEDRMQWLDSAFTATNEENSGRVFEAPLSEKKVGAFRVKKKEETEMELKCVKDKQQWFNNAFKKKEESAIEATKSFESHDTVKSASSDGTQDIPCMPSITHTKSYDAFSLQQSELSEEELKKQRSLVRLYHQESTSSLSENEEVTVSDRLAWLQGAFKKEGASAFKREGASAFKKEGASTASQEKKVEVLKGEMKTKYTRSDPKEDAAAEEEMMSVADRTKWLRVAFK